MQIILLSTFSTPPDLVPPRPTATDSPFRSRKTTISVVSLTAIHGLRERRCSFYGLKVSLASMGFVILMIFIFESL